MNNKDSSLNSRFAVWTELEDEDSDSERNSYETVSKYQAPHRRSDGFKTSRNQEYQNSSICSAPQSQSLKSQRCRKKENVFKESETSQREPRASQKQPRANHKESKAKPREPAAYKYTSNSRKGDGNLKNNTTDNSMQEREFRPMSYKYLSALIEKTPNEIILTLINKSSGFDALLRESNIRRDLMAHVFIALGAACTSDLITNISKLIITVTSNEKFFLINLPQYLATFQKYASGDMHLKSLLSLTLFLQKFQQSQPSSATDTLLIILPLLKMTCEKVLKGTKYYDLVIEKLVETERENTCVMDKYSAEQLKQMSHREKLQLQEPPESYRVISVLPTDEDIHQPCTFLRPNLVKGKYQSVDHYLDVQYRLLREDYVKPLRDGISEYLRLKKTGKPLKSCRDVRIYHNIHIIKQRFAHGSMVHVATFNVKDFPKIKWEYNKRFLTGSLLCLSSDDFKTMLFASVVHRAPNELREGLLLLRFEEITDEVLNLSPLRSFVVIETDAYFEAYRHNLYALLDLDETKLPLKRYIVDVEKTALSPQYLSETTTYDMRPLLLPLDNKYIKHLNSDGTNVVRYEFPNNISLGASSVPVLADNAWPSCSEFGLDSSQYKAMKAAITKEFAVIQGPPGTGKTFIGLRIVQLLLHNSEKWKKAENESSPILIVCYTNHALDQFLEGLLIFTQKIVRIGGRGKNEALAQYQLNNLKMSARNNKDIPGYIFRSVWQKFDDLKALEREIESIKRTVERSVTSVLSETELMPYLSEVHYNSLVKKRAPIIPGAVFPFNVIPITHEWLGINVRENSVAHELIFDDFETPTDDKTGVLNTSEANAHADDNAGQEDEVDVEDEVDIEYVEAQRDIITDDFTDFFEDDPVIVENYSGWQVMRNKNEISLYIENCLNNTQVMEESDAEKVMDVWKLDIRRRWQMYKSWLQKYVEEKQMETLEKQQQLQQEYKGLAEIRMEEDLYVLRNAEIVGMTTTGAAKYRSIVQRLNPQIVVIEEAAEILESHVVTSLAPNTQHVILIGDHQQLKPSPTVHMLAVKYDLNVSLFERMLNNGMDCHRLVKQHRMRPDIASLLVPHIYSSLENHESVYKYENIKGISKNIFFVSHHFCELHAFDSKSKVNEHEAKFLVKLCKYLLLQGYESSQITILTTYSGQFFELKKLAARSLIKNVRITIVDNFQGEENDIILISFVRSNEEGEIGFLKIANRVCVALSRAKKGLFCVGNFELLTNKSKLWKDVVATLHQKQSIGPSLQLVCQNHPEVCNVVASEKDFDTVPEGGCTRPCEFRLSCGHTCPIVCHPYDRAHESVQCTKPCNKICEDCNRKCFNKKCYMECRPCNNLIDKYLSSCGHTIQVKCYQRNTKTPCTKPCERPLPCGHKCTNKCSQFLCVSKCVEKVTVTSDVCGHEVSIKCFHSSDTEELIKVCDKPCGTELACSHTCKGTCSKCHQGRLHIACRENCGRILVCGHECKSLCSKSCPPCKQPCENRCIHSKCPKKCGEPCEKCNERCEWFCTHEKCIRLCGEPCSRLPCNEPCPESLKCGHPCIGFCGEPCPKECRECDREKVTDIFFGSEDEENARYICLEDCGHLFENEGFMHWMNTGRQDEREIQMKSCPKCKTVIRRNLRYGNIIKSCLEDIEKVKRKTYGDKQKNHERQTDLLKTIPETKAEFKDPIYKLLRNALSSKKSRGIQELTTLENVINIVSELLNKTELINTANPSRSPIGAALLTVPNMVDINYSSCDREIRSIIRDLIYYGTLSKKLLIYFLQHEYLTSSEQQLQELSWEVHRLKLINKLLAFVKERAVKYPNNHFESLAKCLKKYAPFSEEDFKVFLSDFEIFSRQFGSAIINVTEMEKRSILKAMGLSLGHWYQCPNGHVYCITECGGAMQEGRCNECNAIIGGTHHRLLSSNRVATDMDGSQQSAWSEAMNLENYRF